MVCLIITQQFYTLHMLFTMVEEEHKTLIEAFIKVLTSIKLSPSDVLKPKT